MVRNANNLLVFLEELVTTEASKLDNKERKPVLILGNFFVSWLKTKEKTNCSCGSERATVKRSKFIFSILVTRKYLYGRCE